MPDHKDRDLVLKLKGGDKDAFEALIGLYMQKSYGIALRLMGNDTDAREMIQEASVKAFKNLHRFNYDNPFGPWFIRILINNCINQLKKIRIRRYLNISDFDRLEETNTTVQLHSESNPDIDFEMKEQSELIQRALIKIPAKQRAAIVLFDIEGYSQEEVAEILECPVGSIMSRIYYGRKRLRKILANYLQ